MLQRFIDGTALKSGQRLDNDNRTHLVLASGKLVLQKTYIISFNLAILNMYSLQVLRTIFRRDRYRLKLIRNLKF